MDGDDSRFPVGGFGERGGEPALASDVAALEAAKRALLVLIVDDELTMVEELAHGLRRHRFQVLTAGSVADALALTETQPGIGVAVCDVRMPGLDGHTLVRHIAAHHVGARATEVVMISGHGTACDEETSRATGVFAFLHKPFLAAELRTAVGQALSRAAMRRRQDHGSGNAVNA